MSMTFNEINDGVTAKRSLAMKLFPARSQRRIVKAALEELMQVDVAQLGMRGGRRVFRPRLDGLSRRVRRRLGQEYGLAILTIVLSAIIYECVCLLVEWIYERWIKPKGYASESSESAAFVNLVSELNEIGRAA